MPIRIQRKRTYGFDLKAESLSRNGLPYAIVLRPSKFGNPYRPGFAGVLTVETALESYRSFIKMWLETDPKCLEPLRGKNLVCWCKTDAPCHADILLELANPPNVSS